MHSFLNADKYPCDMKVTKVKDDQEGKPLNIKFENIAVKKKEEKKLKKTVHKNGQYSRPPYIKSQKKICLA